MMSSNEDSASLNFYQTPGETVFVSSSPAPTVNSPTSSVKIGVPLVVNTTSTSSTITSTMKSPTNQNSNKKHNIGYRLRRFLFPQLRPNTSSSTLAKHKSSTRDVESGENQNFLKHNSSLYSNSLSESNDSRSGSRHRRQTRSQGQQTDVLPEFPTLPQKTLPVCKNGLLECSICLLEQPISQFPELSTCHHRACLNCLRQYLRIEIFDSRINITCPTCSEPLHPNDIKTILRNDPNLVDKYESFMVRRTLITDPDARWCPAPDCDYCVIASGCASCPKLKCERPGCETLFCYHCKQEWHSNQTCDQARAQRGIGRSLFIPPNQSKSSVTFGFNGVDSNLANASTSVDPSLVPRDDIKPCPCCKVLIIKLDDGSCNHMTCIVCGTEFCWLCMQKISDLHYLSPSGCTFWGKKPWSRKKKIMWQLGMLVGAPVGIALIAGIAVPAIIIGIPVWVGRKLYARFERNRLSRHKSNLLVTTGVLTSIFVSPILAAVAVGIGVPILLAYVYGVVPISLCRSGGCGVITSSGVRIELDEDEMSTNVAPDGVSVDTALSGRGIANPSIGEVSLGMSTSLSIGSSSHLDRVVLDIQPDRESSSIAACAGSITSNMLTNGSVNIGTSTHRTEPHIDANSSKRFSFSSQNADASSVTLSFGDRSVNANTSADDASIKVHTGSIQEYSNQSNPSYLSPVEVHVSLCNEVNYPKNDKSKKSSKQINIKVSEIPKTDIMKTYPEPSNISAQANVSSVNVILNKFESRSLEYLTSNYCNICHKSHKPCCPNFKHPNSVKLDSAKIDLVNDKPSTSDSSNTKANQTNEKQEPPIDACCEKFNLPNCANKWIPSDQSSQKKLFKKSVSQGFLASSHCYTTDDLKETGISKLPKPGLTHSLSFTINK